MSRVPLSTRRVLLQAIVFLAAAGMVFPAVAEATPQFGARVIGKVTDAEGEPIANATVILTKVAQDPTRPDEPVELDTDEEGYYVARELSPGRWNLRVEREGYAPHAREVEIRNGPNRFNVEMVSAEVPEAMRRAEAANTAFVEGQEAFRNQDFDTAIARMEEALELVDNPQDNAEALAAIWAIIGRSHFEKDEYEAAIEAYQKWIEYAPGEADPHLELASAYSNAGMKDEAAQEFEKAVDLDPTDPMSHYNVGVTKVNAGLVEEGIASLERAVELQPEYPLAHKNLGYAYARVENYEEAVEHFELFLEQAPDDPEVAQVRDFVEALRGMIGG